MKIALDTNVIVYAASFDDESKRLRAIKLFERLPTEAIVLPLQVLAEFFSVLTRKLRRSRLEASSEIAALTKAFETTATTQSAFVRSIDLARTHGFQIFDAMIVASAAEAGCSWLLSEDMHDGFFWNGVTIVNPFSPARQELIEGLIAAG